MDKFNYLMVVVSVILGLGITHLLSGIVDYVQNRDRITWCYTQLMWIALLFLLQVEYWWTTWSFGQVGDNFGRYLAALTYPSLLFVASGILVPKLPDEGEINLRERYYANHRWFFGTCALALLVLVFYKHLVLGVTWAECRQTLGNRFNLYRLAGLGLVLLLALIGNRWVHRLLSLLCLALLAVFMMKFTLRWSFF